jgi:radical SAM family uncharacterized protein/radical SAM-linked protein
MNWTPSRLESTLISDILPFVSKPNRYVGNERNAVVKDWDASRVRFLLCYPDAYEVGMSHTGTQILYHIVNRDPRWLLERAYAPWPDMEERMREFGLPLFSLESKRPAADFDLFGFTLQSELTYTNLLNCLDLAGIPLRQADRSPTDPLIVIGGPCASNPEPLAPFVDFALIGDAEDAIHEILEVVGECKAAGATREETLLALAVRVTGVYVPSLYDVPSGARTPQPTRADVPFPVVARKVPVLRPDDHPRKMVVPLTGTTHDRLPIEVMRGCMRGCRFCQAGYLYRPARERDVDEIQEIAETGIADSGWQEVSLLSLSTADYSQAGEMVDRMSRTVVDRGVNVSLPSLRADEFSVGLAEAVSRVRKSGFTFAPEAGSQRLRNVINKGITEEDILGAVEKAMAAGWTAVKLYFMIGHPTEGDDDFEELAGLVEKIKSILRRHPGHRHITLGFSPFVPKAHTPFQWERQDDFETTEAKLTWVKSRLRGRGVEIRHHQPPETAIEGIISRGGREIGDVVESAWRRGARFDGWGEWVRFDHWLDALTERGLTLRDTFREIGEDEQLPWEIVTYKIDRGYFLKERHKAYRAGETDECKHVRCTACGVCDFAALHNVLAPAATSPLPEPVVGLLRGVPATTVRFAYRKDDRVRFISHLDVLRELERAFRRCEAPLVYSEGFSPRPRLSAGPPLALGWTSDAEWLDVDFAGQDGDWSEARLAELLAGLNATIAGGLVFVSAAAMPRGTPSLVVGTARSLYHVRLPEPLNDWSVGTLETHAAAYRAAPAVLVERERKGRKRPVDLQPLTHDISVLSPGNLLLELETSNTGSAKPTEVAHALLGLDAEQVLRLQVHKVQATGPSGEHLDSGSVARAEGQALETRNLDQWEYAGNPRGDPRG